MSAAKKKFTIYTDGGCDPNPGPGAWAALVLSTGVEREMSGYEAATTNNRMELTAAIQSLNSLPAGSEVELFTDSQYVQKGIEEWLPNWLRRNWKSSSGKVANRDLWELLVAAAARHTVRWHWVRGHAGNMLNQRVDRLVVKTRRSASG